MRRLTTLAPTVGPGDVATPVARDGAVIVDGFIDQDLLERLRAELAPWAERRSPGVAEPNPEWQRFYGTRTVRFAGLAAKAPSFVDVLTHPTLLGWADEVLRPHGGYQLSSGQTMIVGPGEPAQYLHRDQSNWPFFNGLVPHGPEVMVNALIALTDFTEANGATRVVPGSHAWADSPELFHPSASVPAEMAAGSALLFTGRTIHGAGANTTDGWRWGMHVGLCLGWLRPEEAHQLSIPEGLVPSLPARARELLGFAQYDPHPNEGGRLWLVDLEDPALRYRTPSPAEERVRPATTTDLALAAVRPEEVGADV
ncbi:MAG TPA: phytanoyl-CoA dioxygenase family protein [Acidimicrobiales bacterium]|nr:phytanoyl-CoA dioxygenase family protein [Acidimicrobiales bacterium]